MSIWWIIMQSLQIRIRQTVATENACDSLLSTQSGIANCTYTSLQPEKSCLYVARMSRTKESENRWLVRLVGLWGHLLCFWRLCTVFHAVCAVSRGRYSALWGSTFETVSPRKAHKQQQELCFLIIPYCRVSPGGPALLVGIRWSSPIVAVCTIVPK